MKIQNLVLNGHYYRYSIYPNDSTEQWGILLLGALQEIETVTFFSKYLSETVNVVVVEVPGTGKTPALPAHISIREQSQMLLDLINFLHLENAHIFAFSYATAIGVELCDLWDGVNSLSICGGVPGIPQSGREKTLDMISSAIRDNSKGFANVFISCLTSDNPHIPRQRAVRRVSIAAISKYGKDRVTSFVENSLRLLVHSPCEIDKITSPCLVCVGEHDPYLTRKIASQFVQKMPHSHFVVIKNADHLLHLQQPYKTANALVTLARNLELVKATIRRIESDQFSTY